MPRGAAAQAGVEFNPSGSGEGWVFNRCEAFERGGRAGVSGRKRGRSWCRSGASGAQRRVCWAPGAGRERRRECHPLRTFPISNCPDLRDIRPSRVNLRGKRAIVICAMWLDRREHELQLAFRHGSGHRRRVPRGMRPRSQPAALGLEVQTSFARCLLHCEDSDDW